MLSKNNNQSLAFSIFENYPELICCVSTMNFGDLNIRKVPLDTIEPFISPFKIKATDLIFMEQVHGSQVSIASTPRTGEMLPAVDGVVSTAQNYYFSVRTADCVPLFFYDPVVKVFGVAHAGWIGTLQHIAQNVIEKMTQLGSQPANILVAIGPHIGACCYNVAEERAQDFMEDLGRTSGVISQNRQLWFLDIGQANRLQLLASGILLDHIDAPIGCTACQANLYFSYRREGSTTYGEMLGIIGIKAN